MKACGSPTGSCGLLLAWLVELLHVRRAATTQRCAWCKTGYSQFVHAFTLKPICYACFEGKCKTDPTLQMVNKSTAKDVYLCR